jgi:putative membrane protein
MGSATTLGMAWTGSAILGRKNAMKKTTWQLTGILSGSMAALAGLIYIIYYRDPTRGPGAAYLPAMNASFNALTSFFIIRGLMAIHQGNRERHRHSMLAAFAFSTLFLLGYIVYHMTQGETPFPGHGWVRPLYFFILISHIVLSAFTLPMVLSTFYFALSGNFVWHKRLARITYPVWLYVSLTGVVIFAFLKIYT